MVKLPPIIQVGDVLLSSEILTEKFCCDLSVCKGQCCVEGDAGAPVTMEEIAEIEDCLDEVWSDLSASAQSVIDKQGVAYTDQEGDLVTSIVRGKDCVFTFQAVIQGDGSFVTSDGDVTKEPSPCITCCALEKAFRAGNRWDVCKAAIEKGKALNLPLYQFLKDPLIRRFGETWYQELLDTVKELKAQGYL